MEDLILGVNALYRLFCFFKPFPMVGKGLSCLLYSAISILQRKARCVAVKVMMGAVLVVEGNSIFTTAQKFVMWVCVHMCVCRHTV